MRCLACLKPTTTGFEHERCQCNRYCQECGCYTNHTTAWHLEAAKDMPQER